MVAWDLSDKTIARHHHLTWYVFYLWPAKLPNYFNNIYICSNTMVNTWAQWYLTIPPKLGYTLTLWKLAWMYTYIQQVYYMQHYKFVSFSSDSYSYYAHTHAKWFYTSPFQTLHTHPVLKCNCQWVFHTALHMSIQNLKEQSYDALPWLSSFPKHQQSQACQLSTW